MTAEAAAVLQGVHGEVIVLEAVRAEASIDDLLAEVSVTQHYRNPEATNVEVVYTFPLPSEGVLLGFELEIGDRRLAGMVVEKAKAEHRYEEAITDGDTAVLLEQATPGIYTASLGNLLPGETATIRFRYGLLLRWNGDRVRFAMPTTIAPRYGDPAATGLAPHQSPWFVFDAERAFELAVTVRGLLRDARFVCPSHDIDVTTTAEATRIALAEAAAVDRDFVLEAHASPPPAATALVARDLDGWVVLASFRPEIPAGGRNGRRSVTIVVDCSGSMGGDSIAQAREALERILDGLRAGDLFDIVAFGSSQRALFGRATPVSETTVAQARRFVRALDADMGGTEIGAALDVACAIRSAGDLQRDIFLVTDGQVWDCGSIVARVKRYGHRFFTVGVGSAVAEAFVRGLAEATGGACEFVTPRENMAERIHRHFQRMYAPRARSASVRWPARASCSVPDAIGPVYGGDTVHLFAWFAEKPEGRVGLQVTLADGRVVGHETEIRPFAESPVEKPAAEGASLPTLTRLAAARRMAATDDDEAATALALRYQLVSAWTHFLVVHLRAETEKAEDLPTIVRVPQVLAAGWHGTGTVYAKRALLAHRPPIDELGYRRMVEERRRADFLSAHAFRDAARLLARRTTRLKRMAKPPEEGMAELAQRRLPVGADAGPSRDVAAGALGPSELVARLNARAASSLPSIADLELWGIPETVLEALRDLVDEEEETVVVAAFLYALARTEAGNALDRRVRRLLLEACKTRTPPRAVMDAVTSALDAWRRS